VALLPTADPCPVCGFSPRQLTPPDAPVALRSYPRRYRAVLVRPDDEDLDVDAVVRRPGADGWSALGHAAHVARAIAAAAGALDAVAVRDEPTVSLEPEQPADASGTDVDSVLADLAAGAEQAAGAIGRISGPDWNRPAQLAGDGRVQAIDLLRHAVHEGTHHLKLAERAVEEALRTF
jgi:hypothetical protein